MLPAAYQVPAAAILLAGGLVACFSGYRLFKFVLGIFGFIVGAIAARSIFGAVDTTPMIIGAVVGGIAGAALLLAAYFVGVALVGAGIGALLVNLIWTQVEGDPHPAVVILFSVAGAVVATLKVGTDPFKIAEFQDCNLVTFPDPKDATVTLMGWIPKDAFTKVTIVDAGIKDAAVDAAVSTVLKCPAGQEAIINVSAVAICRKKCTVDKDCKTATAGACAAASTAAGKITKVCANEAP